MRQFLSNVTNLKAHFKVICFLSFFIVFVGIQQSSLAQGLYTARGYWEESNKETYKTIKHKQNVGDPVSDEEMSYLLDFEDYLNNYYQKLSEGEKELFHKMKPQWDREIFQPIRKQDRDDDFEWRGRDRAINIAYGIYYGASLVSLFEIDNAAVVGIPLITGGLWAMGPVINPQKYEGIDRSVVRAGNTGKFLGLIYGGSLGLAVGGNGRNEGKTAFVMSTLGSIALGEVAFQMQKKKRYSEGHIEIMRHHGILGSYVGLSTIAAADGDNGRVYGLASLVGGATGLALGNITSKSYAFTKGDGRYVTNMSSIGVGIGFAIAGQIAIDNDGSSALFLIPAGLSIAGTTIAQRATRGVNLTNKQGSTINYASGGAALLGLGIAAIAESSSTVVWIGLPSGLALVTQEILFSKYKNENLNFNLSGKNNDGSVNYTFKIHPENYFVNQQLQAKATALSSYSQLSAPIVNFKLSF
ncbi:hypothetical protein ACFSKL_15400 [Belliella marina]|uniref:Uncharacterized protein n=1 Tax=Belliella marina TaxID=1644146 RepID=A0ABW4VQ17_9BACT